MEPMVATTEQDAPVWGPPPGREWTVDALDALPPAANGLRLEILDGTLLVTPAPGMRHQRAVGRLYQLLAEACPPGLEAFVAPFDWRPDDRTSLQPDVVVVDRALLTEKGEVPALVIAVEVLSPSTARYDRMVKLSRYADGGVRQYWLVDPSPEEPSVEVYELGDTGYRLAARAAGSQALTVAGPVALTVRPAELVAG